MDFLGSHSVGIKQRPAVDVKQPGTAEHNSTPPMELEWSTYLDFSQDEAASGLFAVLAEEGKVPSIEDATQGFGCQNHLKERNQIEQSAQKLMSPTSVIPSQAVLEAIKPGDREGNQTAQSLNTTTNFTTPDKSNIPGVVEVEEHHDPDGLAGLFGLTLEQACQGMRRPVKKNKPVEPIQTRTLYQPAKVQKTKPPVTKSASIQRNRRYAGLSDREQSLGALLEEELQQMNSEDNPSQSTTGEYGHSATPSISVQTLHQRSQPLAQKDGHLTEQQMQSARQQSQTTEKMQPIQQAQSARQAQHNQQAKPIQEVLHNQQSQAIQRAYHNQQAQTIQQAQSARQAQRQAQHIQQFRSIEQVQNTRQLQPNPHYNALQRQTQSLLAKENILQGNCQPPRQMGSGHETSMYQPHLVQSQQSYRQNWSSVQTHAHPQVQHMGPHSYQRGSAPMNYSHSPPAIQATPPPIRQMASSPHSVQANNLSHQQIFYQVPQNISNGSSQIRSPGHQQSFHSHNTQIPAFLPQTGYSLSHPQFQTQPPANHAAEPTFHGMTHNAQAPQQHVRRQLTAQQQLWFQFYTQGHT